jgi:DNA-binding response OmpR family regulator
MRPAILIVDDDRPLLDLLKTLVQREDRWEVVTCGDGEAAIAALEERHFDVVLLDLMMPRRSGFDVIDYLRAHRPAQLRVVLVLTASSYGPVSQLDPGVVHGIVAKPFDTQELLALVRNIIDRDQVREHESS